MRIKGVIRDFNQFGLAFLSPQGINQWYYICNFIPFLGNFCLCLTTNVVVVSFYSKSEVSKKETKNNNISDDGRRMSLNNCSSQSKSY